MASDPGSEGTNAEGRMAGVLSDEIDVLAKARECLAAS